ncbi:hypothetical protein BJ912DRAFT_1146936 [Pholiota molesta]|nr:hypothetical protein BJ912DRAFT_1146936 [Pholiota molesta]
MGALWRGHRDTCARGWVAATVTGGGGGRGCSERNSTAGLEGIIYGPPTPPPAKRSPIGNRNRNLHIALRPNGESPRTLGSGTEGGPTTHPRLVRQPDLQIGGGEGKRGQIGTQQPSLGRDPWIESQTDPSAPAPEADDTAHVAPGWQTDCSLACPAAPCREMRVIDASLRGTRFCRTRQGAFLLQSDTRLSAAVAWWHSLQHALGPAPPDRASVSPEAPSIHPFSLT